MARSWGKSTNWILTGSGVAIGFLTGLVVVLTPIRRAFLGDDGRIQWETLATGFAAVVVAWVTVSKLNEQIRQTDRLAQDQRQRRARAARAVLPLALAEIGDHALACIQGLYALRPYFQTDGAPERSEDSPAPPKWKQPNLPENLLSVLKECIEFEDAPQVGALTDLVRHYQIQNTRLSEDLARLQISDGVRLTLWANIERAMIDAAELYARAGALLPFARGKPALHFALDRSEVYSAFLFAGCFINSHEMDRLADDWSRRRDAETAAA